MEEHDFILQLKNFCVVHDFLYLLLFDSLYLLLLLFLLWRRCLWNVDTQFFQAATFRLCGMAKYGVKVKENRELVNGHGTLLLTNNELPALLLYLVTREWQFSRLQLVSFNVLLVKHLEQLLPHHFADYTGTFVRQFDQALEFQLSIRLQVDNVHRRPVIGAAYNERKGRLNLDLALNVGSVRLPDILRVRLECEAEIAHRNFRFCVHQQLELFIFRLEVVHFKLVILTQAANVRTVAAYLL